MKYLKGLKKLCVWLLAIRWTIWFILTKFPASLWESFLASGIGRTVQGWFESGVSPWREIALAYSIFYRLCGVPLLVVFIGVSVLLMIFRSNPVYGRIQRLKCAAHYIPPVPRSVRRVYLRYYSDTREGCIDIQRVKVCNIGNLTVTYSEADGCCIAADRTLNTKVCITDEWTRVGNDLFMRQIIYDEAKAEKASRTSV